MSIDPSHKRIAGLHVGEDGVTGVVWLALDDIIDEITVYDSCLFKAEIPLVIAESINARGRDIPIAWSHKEMADQLRERGCRLLWESAADSDAMAEINSREIWERMRTRRMKVQRRLQDWADEFKSFDRTKNKIPRDSHPLMSATRLAISQLKYAKRLKPRKAKKTKHQRVAMI